MKAQNILIKVISLIVIVVPALYFGYKGQTAEMGIAVVVGALAGAFLSLEKFDRFKGAGFEAELKKVEIAVNEAYATINDMKEVAKPLILTLLSNLTFGGRWGGAPRKDNDKYTQRLMELSKSLEIFDGDIANAANIYHHHNIWDWYSKISEVRPQSDVETGKELSSKLYELYDRSTTNYPNEKHIRDIFVPFTILPQTKAEYEEAIQDYLYYLENKEPRREVVED